jgi:hypothetical protein
MIDERDVERLAALLWDAIEHRVPMNSLACFGAARRLLETGEVLLLDRAEQVLEENRENYAAGRADALREVREIMERERERYHDDFERGTTASAAHWACRRLCDRILAALDDMAGASQSRDGQAATDEKPEGAACGWWDCRPIDNSDMKPIPGIRPKDDYTLFVGDRQDFEADAPEGGEENERDEPRENRRGLSSDVAQPAGEERQEPSAVDSPPILPAAPAGDAALRGADGALYFADQWCKDGEPNTARLHIRDARKLIKAALAPAEPSEAAVEAVVDGMLTQAMFGATSLHEAARELLRAANRAERRRGKKKLVYDKERRAIVEVPTDVAQPAGEERQGGSDAPLHPANDRVEPAAPAGELRHFLGGKTTDFGLRIASVAQPVGGQEPVDGLDTRRSTQDAAPAGSVVHAAWVTGMLIQGREVAPERLKWETLDRRDRELDEYIESEVLLAHAPAEPSEAVLRMAGWGISGFTEQEWDKETTESTQRVWLWRARKGLKLVAPEIVRAWVRGLTDDECDAVYLSATSYTLNPHRVPACNGFGFRAALEELIDELSRHTRAVPRGTGGL